jgi:hypothetical protein
MDWSATHSIFGHRRYWTHKAEVGHSLRHHDLPEQHTSGTPHIDAITAARVHIALQVTFDTVGNPCLQGHEEVGQCHVDHQPNFGANTYVGHGKYPSIAQEMRAMPLDHIESISVLRQNLPQPWAGSNSHCADSHGINGAVSMDPIGICNVHCLLIRREAKAVGSSEAICNNPNVARLWIEAVHLAG